MSEMPETTPPTKVLVVASNPAVSDQTGWPIGFWWAELTHPFWELTQAGFEVTISSPDGGPLEADGLSDPRHESGYSAADVLSLGFLSSPEHRALLEDTPAIADLDLDEYAAVLLIGGQGPMYTFRGNPAVLDLVRTFFESGRPTALVCHATCVLLDATGSDGELIVSGRTWTGFADAEEDYADAYVGQRIQPFWIEEEARKLASTNFITHSPFTPFAVRDGNLITGQQQFSGAETVRLLISALGRAA